MKSRIVNKPQKMVLTYGIQGDRLNSLLKVTKSHNIVVRQVMPSELSIKVSNLLRVSQLSVEEYPKDAPECLLISGLDDLSIERFLDSMKSNGLYIPLKAVLTPTNNYWSFQKLLDNLIIEHNQLNKG